MTTVLDYTPAIDPIVNNFRLEQIKLETQRGTPSPGWR